MLGIATAPDPQPGGAGEDAAALLRSVLGRMQVVAYGCADLDLALEHALVEFDATMKPGLSGEPITGLPPPRWSRDLSAALTLLPQDHNFTVGLRDGVSWAWIQPNDGWEPAGYQQRHDHPYGSGLVVADTAALALACAAIVVRIRLLEAAERGG